MSVTKTFLGALTASMDRYKVWPVMAEFGGRVPKARRGVWNCRTSTWNSFNWSIGVPQHGMGQSCIQQDSNYLRRMQICWAGALINTVKLCYSESGWPRHIFSLLPSSRYSQMTNLPRETKGNNLGENANGTVRSRARRRWEEGEGGGDYTPHKDAPFVVFLCYRPPRDVPYRELDDEVGVGRVARTFVTRKDIKSLVITEMIIH